MAHPLHHGGEYVVALFVGVCDLGACVWKWRWYGARESEPLAHEVSRGPIRGQFPLHSMSPLIIFLAALASRWT